jgi:hypothetical protein
MCLEFDMKNKKIITLLLGVFSLTMLIGTTGFAAVTPLSLGVAPPVQLPPQQYTITGARISLLYGNHSNVYGLDLGVVGNITQQNFVGIGLAGIFNATHGQTRVTNVNTYKIAIYGLQLALFANYNKGEAELFGLQVAAANVSEFTTVYGLQAGLFNKAKAVYGFQIGIVNMASSLHGVQIGLLNFNDTGLFKVSPFLNVGF